jgi:hypothetical protein
MIQSDLGQCSICDRKASHFYEYVNEEGAVTIFSRCHAHHLDHHGLDEYDRWNPTPRPTHRKKLTEEEVAVYMVHIS